MARTSSGPRRYRCKRSMGQMEGTNEEQLERKRVIEKYLDKQDKKRKLVTDLVKQALDDQEYGRQPDYSNMNTVVQQWIKDDQERRLKRQINEELELDVNLVKQLPRDIIFDIIDFIPTFSERVFSRNLMTLLNKNSKASGISVEDMLKELPDSMNPEKLKEKRTFECSMVYDCKFLTCHKMRLICKEYALRMKKEIFSVDSLDLTFFDAENRYFLIKLISFIKDQQYYHDKNECDNVLMYFHFQKIKETMLVPFDTNDIVNGIELAKNIDIASNGNETSDDDTVMVNETTTATTTIPDTTTDVTIPAPVIEGITPEKQDEIEEEIINMYSGHLDLIPHHDQSIQNHTQMYQRSLPIELSSQKVLYTDSDVIENFLVDVKILSPIIGVNTFLKSLKINGDLHYELYPVFLSSCLNLKKISLYNSFMSLELVEAPPIVHENIEILEFIFPTTDTYELFDSLENIFTVFPNLSTLSVSMEPTSSYLLEDIHQGIDDFTLENNTKKLVFTIDGSHYKDITPTGRARKWPTINILFTTSNSLSSSYFSTVLLNCNSMNQDCLISNFISNDEDIPLDRKKEFMDHLFIDGNYPIESCFEGGEHPLLFQYAVYIANEYQNARLYSQLSNNRTVEDALRYGFRASESWEEVLKSLNPNDFKLVLSHIKKKYTPTSFFKLIRTLFLESLTNIHASISQSTLLALVDFLKTEQFEFSDIFSPVKCIADPAYLEKFNIATLHIPFLSYALFTNVIHAPTRILSFAKDEDLYYTNENGDSFLTCGPTSEFSFTLIDIALKRAPKLAHILNKQNRAALHIFAATENTDIDWFEYCKEAYGFNMAQTDIVGKTALDYLTIPSQIVGRMFQ